MTRGSDDLENSESMLESRVGRNSLLKGWKIWIAQKRISVKPCLLCLLTVLRLFSVMQKWPRTFRPLTVREPLKLLLRKCLGKEVEGANWLSVHLWSGFLDRQAVEKAQFARLPARGSIYKLAATCKQFDSYLLNRLGWCHVSHGQLVREEEKSGSRIGKGWARITNHTGRLLPEPGPTMVYPCYSLTD